jgi:antitoxin component HigA of HigAB toxin-antitoxin module
MTRVSVNGTQDWLTQKLENPEFRKAFDQERAVREFQDQLQAILDQRGLNRKDLADLLGKSGAFVSQCMRRGSNLTIATMSELASACGFELHILLRRHAVSAGAIFSEPDWTSWQTNVTRAKAIGGPHLGIESSDAHLVPWLAEETLVEESARAPPEVDFPRNGTADASAAFAPFCSHLGLNA